MRIYSARKIKRRRRQKKARRKRETSARTIGLNSIAQISALLIAHDENLHAFLAHKNKKKNLDADYIYFPDAIAHPITRPRCSRARSQSLERERENERVAPRLAANCGFARTGRCRSAAAFALRSVGKRVPRKFARRCACAHTHTYVRTLHSSARRRSMHTHATNTRTPVTDSARDWTGRRGGRSRSAVLHLPRGLPMQLQTRSICSEVS